MKRVKQLLTALLSFILVSASLMIGVFADELPLGDLRVAYDYLSKIEATMEEIDTGDGTVTEDAIKPLAVEYDEYMASHRFANDTVGQVNMKYHLEKANDIKRTITLRSISIMESLESFDLIDTENLTVAFNKAYMEQINAKYNSLYFNTDTDENGAYLIEEYGLFIEEYNQKLEGAVKQFEEAYEKYWASAPTGEYSFPIAFEYDFEPVSTGTPKTPSNNLSSANIAAGWTDTFEIVEKVGGGANGSDGYYIFTNNDGNDCYQTLSFNCGTEYPGFILEMDVYYLGGTLQFSYGSVTTNGTKYNTNEWGSFSDAAITFGKSDWGNASGKTISDTKGMMVKDSWNHVTIAYNAIDYTYDFYCNYQKLGTHTWKGTREIGQQNRFRVKISNNTTMIFDNIIGYYGSQPRDPYFLTSMGEKDALLYFADILFDDNMAFDQRSAAYSWISTNILTYYDETMGGYTEAVMTDGEVDPVLKKVIDEYFVFSFSELEIVNAISNATDTTRAYPDRIDSYDIATSALASTDFVIKDSNGASVFNEEKYAANTKLKAAIEGYLAFDRAAMVATYMQSNDEQLAALTAALIALDEKKAETLADRIAAADALNAYITSFDGSSYLDRAGEAYTAAVAALETETEKNAHDIAATNLSTLLDEFEKSTNYDARFAKYNEILEASMYQGVSLFDDCESLDILPALKVRFEAMVPAMEAMIRTENSKTIINAYEQLLDYLEFTIPYDPQATNPDTGKPYGPLTTDAVIAFVEANTVGFTTVKININALHQLYVRGYDETVDGVSDAVDFYAPIYAYFYNLLQIEHIAILEETLARYANAVTYIDQLTICQYLENYLATEDVDEERTEIAAIITQVAEIRASLDSGVEEEAYLTTILENVAKFAAEVEKMKAATDYVSLKEAYDAAGVYYYFMDIREETAREAIAFYAEYERQLQSWETYGEMFIATVAALSLSSSIDDTYKTLCSAAALLPNTDASYTGMTDAIAAYNAAYNEYMQTVNTINSEISETAEVMSAERTPYSVIDTVIGYFKKLFE